MGWTDQVAVVTGSSRGIGRAIALALAARGAAICVNYAAHAGKAEAAAAEIATAGGHAIAVQAMSPMPMQSQDWWGVPRRSKSLFMCHRSCGPTEHEAYGIMLPRLRH